MTPRLARRFVLFAGLCIPFGMTGCGWRAETGFVEIKRGVNLAGADLLMLNTTSLADLAQKDRLIIQERVGAATLELKRGETSQKICEFEIKKNRVVTITITYINAAMRCTVQS